jgi:uncharacterized protein (DUF1499 family)
MFLISLVALALIGFLLVRFVLIPLASPMPSNLGLTATGELHPCPSTPNCVSSTATDELHAIAPFRYAEGEDTAVAQTRLLNLIQTMSGATIHTNQPGYLHVIFRTPFMGFYDDAEFLFDETNQQIHLRSAARLGQGDLGNNRARLETIRTQYNP